MPPAAAPVVVAEAEEASGTEVELEATDPGAASTPGTVPGIVVVPVAVGASTTVSPPPALCARVTSVAARNRRVDSVVVLELPSRFMTMSTTRVSAPAPRRTTRASAFMGSPRPIPGPYSERDERY